MKHANTRRARMRGLSLVELMVGVAVSLFVVAAAALLAGGQLSDNRRLLQETQLQQDLRATMDIVTRELRRSSYWSTAEVGVPAPTSSGVEPNPFSDIAINPSAVSYRYRRGPGAESFGFDLTGSGVIRACQSTGGEAPGAFCNSGWQDLTDVNTVRITRFDVGVGRSSAPANQNAMVLPCPQLCLDGTTGCWPRVEVRELVITIEGVSRSDSSVVRRLTSSVRLRNDRVTLSSEAPTGQSCPIH